MKSVKSVFGLIKDIISWVFLTLTYIVLMLVIGVLNMVYDIVFFMWQMTGKLRNVMSDVRREIDLIINA